MLKFYFIFFNPEIQLKDTESAIKKLLTELRWFKSVTRLVLVFKKLDIKSMTLFIQTQKQKWLSMKVTLMMFLNQFSHFLSIFINLAIERNVCISKYDPLAESSYIKLLKKIDHSRKGLIHIQNIDNNECFRWSIVRYLNPGNHHPAGFCYKDKNKDIDLKNWF